MVDAHLLSEVDTSSGAIFELEKYVTLDSALAALRDETKKDVSWHRQKRLREPSGWIDPTGQARFDDGARLVGCKVYVENHGEGTVVRFEKATFGSSVSVVKFENVMGGDGTPVKLRRKGNDEKRWLVQVDAAGAAQKVSVAAEDQARADSVGMVVSIGVSGWLGKDDDSFTQHWQFLHTHMVGAESHALRWESELLCDLGACFEDMVKGYLGAQLGKLVAVRVGLGAVTAALALPATLYTAASVIDNPWSMAIARADKAGVMLANLLLERQHGHRPVILMGYSVGARMVFSCLETLAAAPGGSGRGIVDSAFLLGCPVEADAERWAAARSVVADRLVSGYAPGDWLLSLIMRGSMNLAWNIAGLAPVPSPGVENVHVGSFLGAKGHLKYRARARKIFEALGVAGSGIAGGGHGES